MSGEETPEPIVDDEILYRRVPESQNWFDPMTRDLSPAAFGPNKRDLTGISLSRAKLRSLDDAARGKAGKRYYVAKLRVCDLLNEGIRIVPTPTKDDLGHAELPDLNAGNRRSDDVVKVTNTLAKKLVFEVVGPFLTPEISQPSG